MGRCLPLAGNLTLLLPRPIHARTSVFSWEEVVRSLSSIVEVTKHCVREKEREREGQRERKKECCVFKGWREQEVTVIDAEPNTPTNTFLIHTPTCVTPPGRTLGVRVCASLSCCVI